MKNYQDRKAQEKVFESQETSNTDGEAFINLYRKMEKELQEPVESETDTFEIQDRTLQKLEARISNRNHSRRVTRKAIIILLLTFFLTGVILVLIDFQLVGHISFRFILLMLPIAGIVLLGTFIDSALFRGNKKPRHLYRG